MIDSFDLVVAADRRRGIGKNGTLPWRLPGDLKHFRELTSTVSDTTKKNAVIMGRKTWESLPAKFRPLPDRINVVLTRSKHYDVPGGVLLADSLEAACGLLEPLPVERCFILGGGEIYAQALRDRHCKRVYLTDVNGVFDCDTYLPEFENEFDLAWESAIHRDGDIEYTFKTYERVAAR